MGLEARAKYNMNANKSQPVQRMGGLTFFAPNTNLYTHYTWGRGQVNVCATAASFSFTCIYHSGVLQETFGEDPFLAGEFTAAQV